MDLSHACQKCVSLHGVVFLAAEKSSSKGAMYPFTIDITVDRPNGIGVGLARVPYCKRDEALLLIDSRKHELAQLLVPNPV
jgi:hypothetical protein